MPTATDSANPYQLTFGDDSNIVVGKTCKRKPAGRICLVLKYDRKREALLIHDPGAPATFYIRSAGYIKNWFTFNLAVPADQSQEPVGAN